MTESFSDSFNEEFCVKLEYTLCSFFSKCQDQVLNRFWCDGITWAPFYNSKVNNDYLSFEKVQERMNIETTAWMGMSGQDPYEMIIQLGEKSIIQYQNEESLIDCIPSIDKDDWILIDTEDRKIDIYLL